MTVCWLDVMPVEGTSYQLIKELAWFSPDRIESCLGRLSSHTHSPKHR